MPEHESTRRHRWRGLSFDCQDIRWKALKQLWQDLYNTKNVRCDHKQLCQAGLFYGATVVDNIVRADALTRLSSGADP